MRDIWKFYKLLAIIPLLVTFFPGTCATSYGLPCQCDAPTTQEFHQAASKVESTGQSCEHCRKAEAPSFNFHHQNSHCSVKSSAEPEALLSPTVPMPDSGVGSGTPVSTDLRIAAADFASLGELPEEFPPGPSSRLALLSILRI
jgi:hypothetical protein